MSPQRLWLVDFTDTSIIPDAAIVDLGRTVEVNLSTSDHETIRMAFFYILN